MSKITVLLSSSDNNADIWLTRYYRFPCFRITLYRELSYGQFRRLLTTFLSKSTAEGQFLRTFLELQC